MGQIVLMDNEDASAASSHRCATGIGRDVAAPRLYEIAYLLLGRGQDLRTLSPSRKSFWPATTTSSPASTPLRISTLPSLASPTFTDRC
jgi:hypothetical protein